MNLTMKYPGFFSTPLDSSLSKRITGISYHKNSVISLNALRYLEILYFDFNGATAEGEIICNQMIADSLLDIFYQLYKASYPIEKIHLIDEYQADDDLSCLDNNTSCFNYRNIYGTDQLSMHAYGLAIDINPFYNPYVTYPNGIPHISPPGASSYADRSFKQPYQINHDDLCYRLFIQHGFTWGGDWTHCKDYQHFEYSHN